MRCGRRLSRTRRRRCLTQVRREQEPSRFTSSALKRYWPSYGHPDYSVVVAGHARRAPDDSGDSHATSEKRRIGSSIRRWRHRKYFRRSDYQRPDEIHRVVGRLFLRPNIFTFDFVRAAERGRQQLAPGIAPNAGRVVFPAAISRPQLLRNNNCVSSAGSFSQAFRSCCRCSGATFSFAGGECHRPPVPLKLSVAGTDFSFMRRASLCRRRASGDSLISVVVGPRQDGGARLRIGPVINNRRRRRFASGAVRG